MTTKRDLLGTFRIHAKQNPGHLFSTAPEKVTYKQAYDLMENYSDDFRRKCENQTLVIIGDNSLNWIISFLAAISAGIFIIPLPMDKTKEQLNQIGELIGPHYLLNTETMSGKSIESDFLRKKLPSRTAFGLLTSGTTGKPRLALRSESSLFDEGLRYVKDFHFSFQDEIISSLPLYHAFSLGLILGGGIAAGCQINIHKKFLPRKLKESLSEGENLIVPLVPATAHLLCAAYEHSHVHKPNGLKSVIVGAGPVSKSLSQRIENALNICPALDYGSTETGTTLGASLSSIPEGVTGYPLWGVKISIDKENDEPASLFVKTPSPFLGYLTYEGVDKSRISPDGWFSTGDVALLKDDWVSIVGRQDRIMRRGGKSIYPVEIEQLLNSHPQVNDSLILSKLSSDGEEQMVAHVELKADEEVTAEKLGEYLSRFLESYKFPAEWHFYNMFPRTGLGKVDVAGLLRMSKNQTSYMDNVMGVFFATRVANILKVFQRLKMFQILKSENMTLTEIADKISVNKEVLSVLLEILEEMKIVERVHSDKYQLANKVNFENLEKLIGFERILMNNWLSEDSVLRELLHGITERPFEKEVDEVFYSMYLDIMGWDLSQISIMAYRKINLFEGLVVDIGRPAGIFGNWVKTRHPNLKVLIHNLRPGNIPSSIELKKGAATCIFIHNGIRSIVNNTYFDMANLYEALAPDGTLIVSDIFLDITKAPPQVRKNLKIDWLTYGNLSCPLFVDLKNILESIGFTRIQHESINSWFDIILATK